MGREAAFQAALFLAAFLQTWYLDRMTSTVLPHVRCDFMSAPAPGSDGCLVHLCGDLTLIDGVAPKAIGRASAVLVNLLDTWSAGETVETVFRLDPGLAVFYSALFDTRTGESPLFVELEGYRAACLLIIRRIELYPEYRGVGLGAAALEAMTAGYAQGGLVLLEARPLQEFAARDPLWSDRMGYSDGSADLDAATERLVEYYSRLGFSELQANTDGRRILVLSANSQNQHKLKIKQ